MTKSIKLKNDIKIDSSSVNYGHRNLNDVLNGIEYSVGSYLVNNWESNGRSYMMRIGNVKILQFSVRNGTNTVVVNSLPSDMCPSGTLLVPATNLASIGYVIIETTGKITLYGSIYSSGASNLVFNAVYL